MDTVLVDGDVPEIELIEEDENGSGAGSLETPPPGEGSRWPRDVLLAIAFLVLGLFLGGVLLSGTESDDDQRASEAASSSETVVSTTPLEPPTTGPQVPATSPATSTTSGSVPTLTQPPRPDPTYYTFESTLECDPGSDQAALQVVEAFFTAYNERDLDRLEQLTSPDLNEIWDPSALSHTGQVLSTDLAAWARAGWEIDDRFELRQLVDYGQHSGSDVILIRRNQGTGALEIDGLVVGFTVSSGGCTIVGLVGHISSAVTNCPFFGLYEDQLTQQLGAGWETPSVCTP